MKTAQRKALGCLLLLSLACSAWAQGGGDRACVIKKRVSVENSAHYLAHVYDDGTSTWKLEDVATFNLNCIWYTGPQFNHAGLNHNYYFFDGTNYRFLAAPFTSGGDLYLSSSVPETYILSNTDMDYYFYDWDGYDSGKGIARGHENPVNGWWTVYWVAYDLVNNEWKLSTHSYDITDNSARSSYLTITPNGNTITNESGGLSPLSAISDMEWNESPLTERDLSATVYDYSYDYTPAYDTYEFDEVTVEAVVENHVVVTPEVLQHHTYHFMGSTSVDPAAIVTSIGPLEASACTYLWEIVDDDDHFLSFSDASTVTTSTSDTPTLYYRNQNTRGDKEVTVQLTVTYSNGATQTKTTTVTVKTPCQNPAKSANPTVTYVDVTVYWYSTAESYKVYWQKNVTGAPWFSETVGNVTSYTIMGLEPEQVYNYKVAAICSGVEQGSPTVYNFTTKKAPKALIYGSVFGGGRMADVTKTTKVVIINTDSIGAVYGGNDIAGEVQGSDGSTIILGVDAENSYATTHNGGAASEKVRIKDVYGGGNGYYAYNGSSFVEATDPSAPANVNAGGSVMTLSPNGAWTVPVWTNEGTTAVDLTIPKITKTNITVTNNAVKVDSIFGGAKNAFLTATSDDVSITINGGSAFAVFGGNNFGGTLGTGSQERIVVNNTKTKVSEGYGPKFGHEFGIRYLFGGGNKVGGRNTYITVNGGQLDTIFGGGNQADVLSAHVTVNCAIGAASGDSIFGSIYTHAINSYDGVAGTITVKDSYGWEGTEIYNVRALFGGNNQADMAGLPVITLTSGSVGTVYGGGNDGDMKADVTGTFVYDGTTTKSIKYGTKVEMNSPTMLVDYLYGGCQMSNVDYSTWVEIKNGHVGHVFGGCNISGDVGSRRVNPSAFSPSLDYQEVQGATYVKATGGTIYGNLIAGSNGYYHCNDGIYYISGAINLGHYIGKYIPTHNETNVVVSEDKTATPPTAALVKGNVYAGGNMAPVGFTDYSRESNPYPEFVGMATVHMYGGTVEGNVFGGGNMASIYGSNEIQVSGGTIGGALYGGNDFAGQVAQMSNRVLPAGSDMASDNNTSLKKLGVHTYVKVTGKPEIGTVYGGGNGAYDYASIACCDVTDQPIQTNTFVDIHINAEGGDGVGGHIGNVFGGGNGVTVTGGITVLLNVENYVAGTITDYDHVDNIFGGNNMGDLAILPDIVMLNGRAHTLYGGCNEGAMTGDFTLDRPYGTYEHISSRVRLDNTYTPVGGAPATAAGVVSGHVFGGCRMNGVTHKSIVLVEGGNHPDAEIFGSCDVSGNVPESQVVMTGGTVGDIFGGGDGEYDYDGNNVYVMGSDHSDPANLVATSTTTINKPKSNSSRVDMLGGTVMNNVYGGADAADCGTTYVKCQCGTVMGNVFGGNNKSGNITGNVTVDINGGELYKVFGGCNEGGAIAGQITVNVEHTATCDKSLDFVFGGGYKAPFTPTTGTDNPLVNIKKGTVNKAVFGGGEGVGAKVTAHPVVNIGGFGQDVVVGSSVSESENYGKVFGGGDLAQVEGNPTVNIRAGSVVGSPSYPFDLNAGLVFGGGQGSDGDGYETIGMVTGNPTVNVTGGFIYNKVFGGGELGNVVGTATVDISGGQIGGQVLDNTKPGFNPEFYYDPENHAGYLYDGLTAEHINNIGYIYGGGQGKFISADTTKMNNLGKVKKTHVIIRNDVFIYGNVYGGGDLGRVTGEGAGKEATKVEIRSGTVQRRVFGGGKGVLGGSPGLDDMKYSKTGDVFGDTYVVQTGGAVKVSLYGGAETANVKGDTHVEISGGEVGRRRTLAQIKAQPGHCNVFGAGKGDPAEGNYNLWTNVNNANVEISGRARIYGSVFGGGNDGHVLNDISLDFHLERATDSLGIYGYSGSDGNIFGGGRGYNAVAPTAGGTGGNIEAHVYGSGKILGNVFGGGRFASTGIKFDADLPEEGGHAGEPDLAKGTATLTVDGDVVIGHEYVASAEDGEEYLVGEMGGNIFGGAKGVDMNPDEYTYTGVHDDPKIQATMGKVNNTEVTVGGNVKVRGSVYGGGEMGRVMQDASVTIEGTATIGEVRPINPDAPDFDEEHRKLEYSGTVYGGGWGSYSAYEDWLAHPTSMSSTTLGRKDVGRVMRNTAVIVGTTTTERPIIYNNIYGGGAYASVGTYDTDVPQTTTSGSTSITINNGKIGPFDHTGHNSCVFGGGKGMYDASNATKRFGEVFNTHVTIDGKTDGTETRIDASVFGGGEDGDVVGNTRIDIKGGLIGTTGTTTWDGNVFGGGRNFHAGDGETVSHQAVGRVGGSVTINIWHCLVKGSVFGGGRFGSVGMKDNGTMFDVDADHGTITLNVGGTINSVAQDDEIIIGHEALDDHDPVGGNVYGGGKGTAGPPGSFFTKLAQVGETYLNIDEASGEETWIEGSVFGSGEDGHVLKDTHVNIRGGLIGGHEFVDPSVDPTWCNDIYHGNVYGGGRGLSTYDDGAGNMVYSQTAGKVFGNSNVNITGGRIVRNVYGAGNLGSVGEDGVDGTGLATINISGGIIGISSHNDSEYGNVFGSGHGLPGAVYAELAYVKNTMVTISGTAQVYGSVFGGGEDGHVRKDAVVHVKGGTIGRSGCDDLKGNVYGGGRGFVVQSSSTLSLTAGIVGGGVGGGSSTVYIESDGGTSPVIWKNVYGGGSSASVQGPKTVHMSAGEVKGSVYGGSRKIPVERDNFGLKTINMTGGEVHGNVYGCSYISTDVSVKPGSKAASDNWKWTGFVNLWGGHVHGSVYGAGEGGTVTGSVAVLIGKDAVSNAPTNDTTSYSPLTFANANVNKPTSPTPTASELIIDGSVYAGSNYYGHIPEHQWREFDVTGFSNIYIDGTDYKTGGTGSYPEMHIAEGGGIYGSGTTCEAGKCGRNILIRNYGERNMGTGGAYGDTLSSVTRSMRSIQRVGNLLLDNTNVNLRGERDISHHDGVETVYGIYIIDTSLVVSNASSIVLGYKNSPTDIHSANIDSVKLVRSVQLSASPYSQNYLYKVGNNSTNKWIGVKDDNGIHDIDDPLAAENVNLYYNGESIPLNRTTEENVILFTGASKLYVRYHILSENRYGELQGFFRMSSPYKPKDLESFAYARTKLPGSSKALAAEGDNPDDGGFASYYKPHNYWTDNSTNDYTKKKQYPYVNVKALVTNALFDYRMWGVPELPESNHWYVDGVNGVDGAASEGYGRYPDKPKKTVFSILMETVDGPNCFKPNECVIYAVGPVKGTAEWEPTVAHQNHLHTQIENGRLNFKYTIKTGSDPDLIEDCEYQLQLIRYPGWHKMVNGNYDAGQVTDAQLADFNAHQAPIPETSLYYTYGKGPGAYYGPLIIQDETTSGHTIEMEDVAVEGLGELSSVDSTYYQVNTVINSAAYSYFKDFKYNPIHINAPLVQINEGTTVKMKGKTLPLGLGLSSGTELKHNINNIDASAGSNYYVNSDYTGSDLNGGAAYAKGILQVEGVVSIQDNKQKNGSGTITSNVYLPSFNSYVEITNELNSASRIGITNPIRNAEANYLYNTFSPVAVGVRTGLDAVSGEAWDTIDTRTAWVNNNFIDDLNWFFGKGYTNSDNILERRSSYYATSIADYPSATTTFVPGKTLFHGWTWNNVVRSRTDADDSDGYTVTGDNITISSNEGFAWLISKVNGTNGQTANNLSGKTVKMTSDINLDQYVWVPVGASNAGSKAFAGTFDGQGHLIHNLIVRYIGQGDSRYEYFNYGLFGEVNSGTVKRTFVTSGKIAPEGMANLGGLIGILDGTGAMLQESETAVEISGNNATPSDHIYIGGLVSKVMKGEVHSCISLADIHSNGTRHYAIGGLVGYVYSDGMVQNAFFNGTFSMSDPATPSRFAGLVGYNTGDLNNCYANLRAPLDPATPTYFNANNFGLLIGEAPDNVRFKVNNCFSIVQRDFLLTVNGDGRCAESCSRFAAIPASAADNYGYLYADNFLCDADGVQTDTAVFVKLNEYIDSNTGLNDATTKKYARWARPTLSEINGDYPLLMMCNYNGSGEEGQGDFRSVGTLDGGPFLQYGGPVRDGVGNNPDYETYQGGVSVLAPGNPELDGALDRAQSGGCIFIYGDINASPVAPTVDVSADKVAIHEDAAILDPGTLGSYANTYVGVTFDNPSRNALDSYDNVLHRDWHMFSTPLSDAPLGMDYVTSNGDENDPTNTNATIQEPANWAAPYADGNLPIFGFTGDGYFPTLPASSSTDYGYPYDFYCWYEPEWQWINFKRNGPNHWHFDPIPLGSDNHLHIDYKATPTADANKNETELVSGKGYMMAIQDNTYMQSHGQLNSAAVPIAITMSSVDHGSVVPGTYGYFGNNLIGNPYHAYLDFKAFGSENGFSCYYAYDAVLSERYNVCYVMYPYGGSPGGFYLASQYLHPHQGFFVQTSSNGTAMFNKNMLVSRSTATSVSFRDKPAYRLVNLFAYDADGRGDVVVIEFDRPENGGGEKAKALRNGKHLIYAHHDETDYGAFFAKEGTKKVPVRFLSFENRSASYTLRWELKNGDFPKLYLVDNLLGTVCDMTVNRSYEFEASKNDYLSRFYIVFELDDPEEPEEPENPEDPAHGTSFAFFDGTDWVIDGKGPFALVDMTGRILYATELSGENNRINFDRFARGVYVLRLVEGKTVKTQKIILR